MSLKRRIAASLAANSFGQGVTISTQLLLLPLFLSHWGASLYGDWLLLTAIPAYLAMADLGISSAAGNEMAMRAGASDRRGAQQTFRGAQQVAFLAGSSVLLAGALFAAIVGYFDVFATPRISQSDRAWLVLLLVFLVSAGFLGSVVQAGYRCDGHNASGVMTSNFGRLLEGVSTGLLLVLGQGPLEVCISMVFFRCIVLTLQWIHLWCLSRWLFTPKVPREVGMVRRLLSPSLAFMAFPLGNALALQGPLLLIGAIFGSAEVALFSAMRTLARLPVQITNVLNNAVSPELSRAHGEGNAHLVRKLHRRSWLSTVSLSLVALLGLVTLGPTLASAWLGSGHYHATMLHLLAAVSLLSATWNVSSVVLTAINAHARLALAYVLVNAVCLALAALLGHLWGLTALLLCLLLAELLMFAWVLPQVLRRTEDDLHSFLQSLWPKGFRAT